MRIKNICWEPKSLFRSYFKEKNPKTEAAANVARKIPMPLDQKEREELFGYKEHISAEMKYPTCPLAGCVNDITDMGNFLVASCGFETGPPPPILLHSALKVTTCS